MTTLFRTALICSIALLPNLLPPSVGAEPTWSIHGDADSESSVFGEIIDILRLPDGRTAILDAQQGFVRVFDPSGQLDATLPFEGDGPGEVRRPLALVGFPRGRLSVVQSRPPKLALLPLDGNSAEEWAPEIDTERQQWMIQRAESNGGALVLQTYSVARTGKTSNERVRIYRWTSHDARPELLAERTQEVTADGFVAREFGPLYALDVWGVDARGRLLLADSFDEHVVRVFDSEGEVTRVDRWPGYQSVRRAESRYQSILEQHEAMANFDPRVRSVEVARFERDIQRIIGRSRGGYFVLSSRDRFARDPDQPFAVRFRGDDGTSAATVELPTDVRSECDLFWISGGKLYVVHGGKSASRAARRTSAVAEEVLGEDPCEESDIPDMTIECWQMPELPSSGSE